MSSTYEPPPTTTIILVERYAELIAAESALAAANLRAEKLEDDCGRLDDELALAVDQAQHARTMLDSARLRAERAERALKEIRALGGTSNAIQNARGIASEALMAALTSSEGEQ